MYLLGNYNIVATILSPTRITASSKTGVDQIFITDKLPSSSYVLHTGHSDHAAQKISISIDLDSSSLGNSEWARTFNKTNSDVMNALLSNESWSDLRSTNCVNTKFNLFLDTFLHHFNLAFPLKIKKQLTTKPKKSWITQGIIISCKKKKRLLHK